MKLKKKNIRISLPLILSSTGLLAIFCSAVCVLLVSGCGPRMESYFEMRVVKLNGRPYLMLETKSLSSDDEEYFSIYTPHGNSLEDWDVVSADRLGPAFGLFTCQVNSKIANDALASAKQDVETTTQRLSTTTDPDRKKELEQTLKAAQAHLSELQLASVNTERLGIFHPQRITLMDPSVQPVNVTYDNVSFTWPAETAVDLKGKTYAFGVELPPIEPGAQRVEGTLKVARFDGQHWEELKLNGPKVSLRTSGRGFSLQAVALQDNIKVLWREYEDDQALDQDIEGPRAASNGPVMIASFDGEKFSDKTQTVQNLERGNTTAWTEENQIRLLVQSRSRMEQGIASNGPMVIWNLTPDGNATQSEVIDSSRSKNGLLPFIAAEHFTWEGQEYIIRSDWQTFEIWQKTPEGWTRRLRNPKGLPIYDLENVMLTGLVCGFVMIAFGAGLAFRRRKQAWTLVHKVQARELYASLGLRMCAYIVDLGLVLLAVYGVVHLEGWQYVSPGRLLRTDLSMPYAPFFFIYVTYLSLAEWLTSATIGKFIMGLCVVSDKGERLTLWSALIRNFVGFFERLPEVAPVVSIFMILLGPKKQRMGDIFARTFVVHKGALEAFKAQRAAELAEKVKETQEAAQETKL